MSHPRQWHEPKGLAPAVLIRGMALFAPATSMQAQDGSLRGGFPPPSMLPARALPTGGGVAGGRRPDLTAYQKRYGERLAALAHPPCQAGVLPAAFRDLRPGRLISGGGLALRCLQRLSLRDVATRRCRWLDNRNTRGRPPPVLSY